jgi:hypothetical protein
MTDEKNLPESNPANKLGMRVPQLAAAPEDRSRELPPGEVIADIEASVSPQRYFPCCPTRSLQRFAKAGFTRLFLPPIYGQRCDRYSVRLRLMVNMRVAGLDEHPANL